MLESLATYLELVGSVLIGILRRNQLENKILGEFRQLPFYIFVASNRFKEGNRHCNLTPGYFREL